MSFLIKYLHRADPRETMSPLYQAIVGVARQPHWYLAGGVADTREGRFEMVAALLSLTLLRLEQDPAQKQNSVFLTELFVEDMDGQLRQFGIGDMIVGKHIGKMVSALGGRLGAYRAALGGKESWQAVLERNVWGGEAPAAATVDHVAARLQAFAAALEGVAADVLVAGTLPEVTS